MSEHFTLPGIWKDSCKPNGPNGMCKVHDYPMMDCKLMVWRLEAAIKELHRVPLLHTDQKYWRDRAYHKWITAHPELETLVDAEAFIAGWQAAFEDMAEDTKRQGEVINYLKEDNKALHAGKVMWAEDAKKAHAEAEVLKQRLAKLDRVVWHP